ncbi:MAG: hypothetical protein H6739_01950 [Alphaproteobacteria bacterium]|nr:hypothetical protein [Alphaproteobacteria bacterium]
MALLLCLLLCLLLPAAAVSQGDDPVLAAIAAFNATAHAPIPAPDTGELATLRKGKVVTRLDRGDGEHLRAVGMLLTERSQRALWVSCQDPHFSAEERLIEKVLRRDGPEHAWWYGFLDLPAPFDDRQWVVEVWNNHDAARTTGSWEHPWRLASDGPTLVRPFVERGEVDALTVETVDAAVWVPESEGAWIVIPVDDQQRLLVHHSAADLGGHIPERLVAEYVLRGMDNLLERVDARAESEVPAHYIAPHRPVYSGAGEPIPRY